MDACSIIKVDGENIRKRFHTLLDLFDDQFLPGLASQYSQAVYISKELLHCAVTAYFDDIEKFKAYSGSEYANKDKQAAYTIKWLTRFKPIQIKEGQPVAGPLLTINQSFALLAGFMFLSPGTFNCVSKEFYDQLIYMLTYREVSGKALAPIMHLIECVAQSGGTA